jgi:hypothetical protein
MGWIVDLFSTGGMGAIIGLAGSWLTKRENRKEAELNLQREIELGKLRLDELAAESEHELAMADKQMQRAELEGDIVVEKAEVDAFTESLKAQAKSTGILIIDAVRGLMRPLITVFLLGVSTWLACSVNDLVGGLSSLDSKAIYALYDQIIQQIIFLTVTAVTWWFGSRPAKAEASK